MPTKKPTQPHIKPTLLLTVILTLMALGLIANGIVSAYLLRQDQKQDNQRVAGLILDAVDQMNRPLLMDPSGKQYIPEAKLSLPAYDVELGDVVYNYLPADKDIRSELHIASERSIRTAATLLRNAENGTVEEVFDSVPKLQTCARGVRITFQAQTNEGYQATKKLANGKTAYLFMEDGCKNDKLFEFAKQLESY